MFLWYMGKGVVIQVEIGRIWFPYDESSGQECFICAR